MESKGIVLLVEDNPGLNAANARALGLSGYEVYAVLTLAEAQEQLAKVNPDVILLDVMMPDGDGFEFCDAIRHKTSAHIIFLTAKVMYADRIRGLYSGGDDYITKPFHPEELMARIAAAMRRRSMDKTPTKMITKGSLTLDVISAQAFVDGRDLILTQKEFALLLLLVQNEDTTISAEQIYESVWRQPLNKDKNALQTAFSKLRGKLEQTGYDIISHRGKGYEFRKKQ